MTEWQEATKVFKWREPEPNCHQFKYLGRTPQGGLSGGDDVYECVLCGKSGYGEEETERCFKADEKGKTEAVIVGKTEHYYSDIKEKAVKGKHIIIQDPTLKYPEVITKEEFDKFFIASLNRQETGDKK
jgi:hypothetical protein